MAQPIETTTILNAQPFWMLLEMNTQTGELGQTHKQTDRQTDKQTDATKHIISPASRSIKWPLYAGGNHADNAWAWVQNKIRLCGTGKGSPYICTNPSATASSFTLSLVEVENFHRMSPAKGLYWQLAKRVMKLWVNKILSNVWPIFNWVNLDCVLFAGPKPFFKELVMFKDNLCRQC